MTDKEFRRLRRDELIEIIFQLQENEDKLKEENRRLRLRLKDHRIRIQKAGSIAEAALDLNGVFEAAQKAADAYLEEIRLMDEETKLLLAKTKGQADKTIRTVGRQDGKGKADRDQGSEAS